MANPQKPYRDEDFPKRLRQLISEDGRVLEVIAADVQVSKTNLSDWQTGKTMPRADSLRLLAKYFNVTTDYLLGLTDARTIDADLRAVAEYLGISDAAAKTIHDFKNKEIKNHFFRPLENLMKASGSFMRSASELSYQNRLYELLELEKRVEEKKDAGTLTNDELESYFEKHKEFDVQEFQLIKAYSRYLDSLRSEIVYRFEQEEGEQDGQHNKES